MLLLGIRAPHPSGIANAAIGAYGRQQGIYCAMQANRRMGGQFQESLCKSVYSVDLFKHRACETPTYPQMYLASNPAIQQPAASSQHSQPAASHWQSAGSQQPASQPTSQPARQSGRPQNSMPRLLMCFLLCRLSPSSPPHSLPPQGACKMYTKLCLL